MDKAPLDLTHAILVKDRMRGREIAVWEKQEALNGKHEYWRFKLSDEFREWSETNFREAFQFRQIRVPIEELEQNEHLKYEIHSIKRMNEMYHRDYPEDQVKRLQMVFSNDVDMLLFKMRWL